jgi:ribosomal subunit interface protein
MQTELQITVRDMDHSPALDQRIRDKVQKLERVYAPLMGCRVVAEAPHKHKHQGKHFSVRLDITVPGKEIVVNNDHHEDIYVALRDAFDAAKRQLEDYAAKRRGDIKNHARGARANGAAGEAEAEA